MPQTLQLQLVNKSTGQVFLPFFCFLWYFRKWEVSGILAEIVFYSHIRQAIIWNLYLILCLFTLQSDNRMETKKSELCAQWRLRNPAQILTTLSSHLVRNPGLKLPGVINFFFFSLTAEFCGSDHYCLITVKENGEIYKAFRYEFKQLALY